MWTNPHAVGRASGKRTAAAHITPPDAIGK